MITSTVSIYIIDDDEDDVFLIREIIHELNPDYSLIAFSDEGYLKEYLVANNELPTVILLDLRMRITDGLSTLKWLKGNNMTKSVPVVIFSSSLNPNDIEEAYLSGAAFYMEKLTDIKEQKKLLGYLLKSFAANDFVKVSKEKFILNQSSVLQLKI